MSVTFTPTYPGGPEVNVHSANAADLLTLLGLPAEPDGDIAAEDLLGRILVALGFVGVAGGDVHGRPAVTDGWWTTGGRAPGHLAMRLRELHGVAEWAHHHHADVAWG